jgi:hypothetical protein
MKTATTRSSHVHSRLGPIAIALGLAAILAGTHGAPARADDDRRGRTVQRERAHPAERERSHYRSTRDSRSYSYDRYDRRANVYAPPPVYYAPPSAPPAIDFVFPLRFR